MSRLTRILLCVVLLVVIAVAAMAAYLYASLSAEAVKERLTAYAADNLASDLHLTGEITVKRFPALEVTLPAARLTSKTDGHETARFDSARFSASLWSLALGAVRVSDAEIAGLKTTVTAREPSLTAFFEAASQGTFPEDVKVGKLHLTNGSIRFTAADNETLRHWDAADLDLTLETLSPELSAVPFTVNGRITASAESPVKAEVPAQESSPAAHAETAPQTPAETPAPEETPQSAPQETPAPAAAPEAPASDAPAAAPEAPASGTPAAESHVDRSIKNPEIFVQSNVMGTVNLLQRAKEAWYDADAKTWKEGKKYLQVSTDEVYGALGADGFFMETTPLCPHSPYSSSKASADMFVMAFHDTYGMPVNITRCSNNYGPYQFPEKLIPLMINNVKHHKQLPIYGDGMQIRDWLYVEDHCKAIDMVANGGKIGEVYNVGGHNERPNIFIVKTIINQLHDRLQDEGISEDLIKHVADRLGHDRRYGIDPTKIKNDLGWYPETPFEKGIVLTIDWYLNHQEWMDHVTSGDYQNYYQDMYKNK